MPSFTENECLQPALPFAGDVNSLTVVKRVAGRYLSPSAVFKVLRRRRSVWVAIVALLAVSVATLVMLLSWAAHLGSRADDLAAAAVVLTAGAFGIAVLAGVLATFAYAESIRRPSLTVRAVITRHGEPGDVFSRDIAEVPEIPIIQGRAREELPTEYAGPRVWADASAVSGTRCWLHIALGNDGDATARYVVLTVEVGGLQARHIGAVSWTVLDKRPDDGWVRLQWDGGSDLTVHPTGGISRLPPSVLFDIADAIPGSLVTIDARAVADGAPEERTITKVPVAPA